MKGFGSFLLLEGFAISKERGVQTAHAICYLLVQKAAAQHRITVIYDQ